MVVDDPSSALQSASGGAAEDNDARESSVVEEAPPPVQDPTDAVEVHLLTEDAPAVAAAFEAAESATSTVVSSPRAATKPKVCCFAQSDQLMRDFCDLTAV